MSADRTYNVLFLCTGNSARSVMGEVLLNSLGRGRFRGYSAGSTPRGAVHPLTLEVLEGAGLPVAGLSSKSWDEFARPDAPRLDFVFTVCDNAAGEACPLWPGQPVTAHWGIEDPAAVEGPRFVRRAAFERALDFMRSRISTFVSLPLASIDAMTLARRLEHIGSMDGATAHLRTDA
jgi:arsenate reductase